MVPPAADWPESAWGEFEVSRLAYEQAGHIPGEAARLAYEHLKRWFDGTPWRPEVEAWPVGRRTAWGTSFWSDPREPAIELFGEPPPTWEALSAQRWGPALDDATPGLDIPKGWRWDVANWQHDRWLRWRQLAGELLEGLDHEPTADDIRAENRAAFDLIQAEGR